MNRSLLAFVVAIAAMIAPARAVLADDKPTPEQLEAAKKAFEDGKALHDGGKLVEAIDKFKESYRLSKNPLLLYNIGYTLDEAGQKDKALFYYRKFLSDAPADAKQRPSVTDRVKVIEKENLDADLNGPTKTEPTTTTTPTTTTNPTPTKTETPTPVKIKPPGTYGPNDFQHQVIEEAPPAKPLDISAFVPEDSGFTVTLYYRGSGDSTFTPKLMKWRYKELVGRIPASKVGGNSIQYYLEVKDQQGKLVTRSGKSTSPNLVNIDAGATPRFYPDLTDEGDAVSPAVTKHHDEEDPLHPNQHNDEEETHPTVTEPVGPATPGEGFADVGSKKFTYVKWGATGTAAGMVAIAIGSYILASKQASALVDDSSNCPGSGAVPPCRQFDSYDQDLQSAGKRWQTIENVTLTVGVIAAGVAGYYWYKEKHAKHGELNATKKNTSPEMSWVVAPSIGEGFTGAAAAARF